MQFHHKNSLLSPKEVEYMATLQIYADIKSQPSRAVILFCKVNAIEFEEVKLALFTGDLNTPEYQAINPMKQIPAIVHGDFILFESHAILSYLACAYHVSDHWYPSDLHKRAKLQSVLDWHHTNLRRNSTGYLLNTVLAPLLGKSPNPEDAAQYEKGLKSSLSTIETVWLKGGVKFLLGNDDQPSIADLSLVSEIMQLHLLNDEVRNGLMDPYKKVQQWIEDVKNATNPHFDELHQNFFDLIANYKQKA